MTAKVNATGPKKATAYVRGGIKFNTRSEIGYHMAFGQDIARGFYSYLLTKMGTERLQPFMSAGVPIVRKSSFKTQSTIFRIFLIKKKLLPEKNLVVMDSLK